MALPEIPQYLLEDILNRLEDAKDIAKAQLLCKDWWDAGNNVRSLRIVCLDAYHERARNIMDVTSLRSDGGEASSSQDMHDGKLRLSFKHQVVKILEKKRNIVQLRIEIESKLQAKTVPADERQRTDLWLADPWFLRQLLPRMGSTLQHLCIVDHGQQDIIRRSSIIRILSLSCKRLKTLDLRNMFIDTCNCEKMPSMVSLTWRCVKVTSGALQDINDIMPKLQTLALLGVFGVERGNLTFSDMKVLCLGLSTPAKDIQIDLPKLEKLQLKMQCPQQLIITASCLKYVSFNLDVPSNWKLKYDHGLITLLYGASSFMTLSSFAEKNRNLNNVLSDRPWTFLA